MQVRAEALPARSPTRQRQREFQCHQLQNPLYFSYGLDVVDLYREAFPQDQREKLLDIRNDVQSGESLCHGLFIGQKLIGLSVTERLYESSIGYLTYLATDRCYRNQGLGQKFLLEIRTRLEKQGFSGIILDVEDPNKEDQFYHNERSIRERRLHFYVRNGAKVLGKREEVRPSEGGKIPYLALWIPATPWANVPDSVLKDLGIHP